MCVCVCVCVSEKVSLDSGDNPDETFESFFNTSNYRNAMIFPPVRAGEMYSCFISLFCVYLSKKTE